MLHIFVAPSYTATGGVSVRLSVRLSVSPDMAVVLFSVTQPNLTHEFTDPTHDLCSHS